MEAHSCGCMLDYEQVTLTPWISKTSASFPGAYSSQLQVHNVVCVKVGKDLPQGEHYVFLGPNEFVHRGEILKGVSDPDAAAFNTGGILFRFGQQSSRRILLSVQRLRVDFL